MNDGSFNIISYYGGQGLLVFFQKAVCIYKVLEMTTFTYMRKIFYFTNNFYYVIIKNNKSYSAAFLARDLETKKWVI